MKRPPISQAALASTAELGELLDVTHAAGDEDVVLAPRAGQRVLLEWSPAASAIVCWFGASYGRPRPAEEMDAATAATYERWTDFAREASTERVWKTPKLTGEWRCLGAAVRIGYRSDKFDAKGRMKAYEHEITSAVRVYALGTTKQVIVLRGGSLRVTRRGLEG